MTDQSINALIGEYVAGTLAMPAKTLVDAHLEIVPESREWAQNLEAVAGHSLESGPEEPISGRDAMIAAILDAEPDQSSMDQGGVVAENLEADDWMPHSLRSLVGCPANEIPWRMKIPGVYAHELDEVDGCEVMLLRIKPNAAIPTHTHEGRELALVLKGCFEDGTGHYQRGDVSIADGTVGHKPVAGSDEECICFLVNDAPVRFTGPVARIISSILPH